MDSRYQELKASSLKLQEQIRRKELRLSALRQQLSGTTSEEETSALNNQISDVKAEIEKLERQKNDLNYRIYLLLKDSKSSRR